jgi:hypothetical protein
MGKMPIVSEGTFDSVVQSMIEQPNENFNLQMLVLIEEENPQIGRYIKYLMNDIQEIDPEDESHEVTRNMWAGICLTYKLLRSQAEADEMKETLG